MLAQAILWRESSRSLCPPVASQVSRRYKQALDERHQHEGQGTFLLHPSTARDGV